MNSGATRKLGILVAAAPETPNFRHATNLARQALSSGVAVYLYLIDEAVRPSGEASASTLVQSGVKLFSCAYSLQKRNLPLEGKTTFAGLTVLSDIMSATDRFVSFP